MIWIPRSNPYAPGAGVPPPELAGRDDLIERVSIALDRVRAGRAARGFIFHGLRGVGKTVLLNRIRLDAEAQGFASQDRGARRAFPAGTSFVSAPDNVAQAEPQPSGQDMHGVSQSQLPITMVAAGLPQLLGLAGRAKSYAERLFEFVAIDRLDCDAARAALVVPAAKEGVDFQPAAVAEILKQTLGYPYFLQEWGKHSWNVAAGTPIKAADARRATAEALAELDASFFRVRFDRLTPAEKRYMRAMAELGSGPHRSGDVAEVMGRKVTTVAPVRNGLIAKGMLYNPAHGDTAFTVP